MRRTWRLVPLLALVVAPLAFASPASAATALAVTPNTGLVDQQVVHLSGSGFTPNAQIGYCQGVQRAVPTRSDCGTGPFLTFADANGNFSTDAQLFRFISVPTVGASLDCANPPIACVMAAGEVQGIEPAPGTVAFSPLQFAPAAPVLPTVVPGGVNVEEGSSGPHDVEVPVKLSAVSTQTITAHWTTVFSPGAPGPQAEAPSDYTAASGTVTFAPGQSTQFVTVSVNGGFAVETDEYFAVSFSNPTNAKIGGYYGLGGVLIFNDDSLPRVVPGLASTIEGDAGSHSVSVPVTLSIPSPATVTAHWATVQATGAPDHQADPGTDYVAASGTVTFAPGQTTTTILVSVNGDTAVEPDEYFVVSFSAPTNAAIGGYYGLAGVGITNDD